MAERLKSLEVEHVVVVHPDALNVEVGEGMAIMAGSVINADMVIKRHITVNTAAAVDHDCLIEDFIHLAPGSHLARDNCWIRSANRHWNLCYIRKLSIFVNDNSCSWGVKDMSTIHDVAGNRSLCNYRFQSSEASSWRGR